MRVAPCCLHLQLCTQLAKVCLIGRNQAADCAFRVPASTNTRSRDVRSSDSNTDRTVKRALIKYEQRFCFSSKMLSETYFSELFSYKMWLFPVSIRKKHHLFTHYVIPNPDLEQCTLVSLNVLTVLHQFKKYFLVSRQPSFVSNTTFEFTTWKRNKQQKMDLTQGTGFTIISVPAVWLNYWLKSAEH